MKGFIQTLKNIWSLKELKDKILFTLGLVLVYRFASYISLPAINMAEVGSLLEQYKTKEVTSKEQVFLVCFRHLQEVRLAVHLLWH